MLQYCKELAETVVVGIDSDTRVAELKGPNRPINDHNTRKEMLLALECVDEVVIFDSATELINLVAHHQPDFMVVGEEYKNKEVIGGTHAKEIKYFRKIGEYSTTKILQNSFSGR
jgi:bifunctional ADP-heptose synthase (sugar kinase/adenylyltransferase)